MPTTVECVPINADYDLLRLHRANPARYPHLLESVAHGSPTARYDILFAFPGETLALSEPNSLNANKLPLQGHDFLANLDSWWTRDQTSSGNACALPFCGGWFVYLGYELATQIEPKLNLTQTLSGLPIAFATRIPAAIIRDHQSARIFLLAEEGCTEQLRLMRADLDQSGDLPAEPTHAPAQPLHLTEDPAADFIGGVQRILRYIKNGDVFQVNLSRLWQGELPAGMNAVAVYQRLRQHNPAPFAGLITYGDAAIISSSPERLVKVHNGMVETRPIAGTRPRHLAQQGTDLAATQALLAHPKERAEHIMLIDLERNDLGRVCIPGSIKVDELMGIESYTHVHHIVSNIRGRLRSGMTPGQILRAVFPGGTITGCPKVRCMEIISELEQTARGPYTGSIGYINRDGSMDFNILIRSFVLTGRHISLRAGAGIVADSIPQSELEETRAKARGLLLALA
ncbi:MAG TPA: aminodeoxychorismate synthase component I [Gammaproteobacteria bacterium]|nr:aminodeoxychorismate synthase component I [Gammaproteobacteria bacterium]